MRRKNCALFLVFCLCPIFWTAPLLSEAPPDLAASHDVLPEAAEPVVEQAANASFRQSRQPLFSRRSGRRAFFAPQVPPAALEALMAASVEAAASGQPTQAGELDAQQAGRQVGQQVGQQGGAGETVTHDGAYSDFGPALVHFRPQTNSLFSGASRGSFLRLCQKKTPPRRRQIRPKHLRLRRSPRPRPRRGKSG